MLVTGFLSVVVLCSLALTLSQRLKVSRILHYSSRSPTPKSPVSLNSIRMFVLISHLSVVILGTNLRQCQATGGGGVKTGWINSNDFWLRQVWYCRRESCKNSRILPLACLLPFSCNCNSTRQHRNHFPAIPSVKAGVLVV